MAQHDAEALLHAKAAACVQVLTLLSADAFIPGMHAASGEDSAGPRKRHCAGLLQVSCMVEGRAKPRGFTIAIKWVASVDIMALRSFVRCALLPGLLPCIA